MERGEKRTIWNKILFGVFYDLHLNKTLFMKWPFPISSYEQCLRHLEAFSVFFLFHVLGWWQDLSACSYPFYHMLYKILTLRFKV
jgi:hypothetical protein